MDQHAARARPGRPAVDRATREALLDAAELTFAEHGYVAASLRGIAAASGVNQALIRYYFGTKQALFETVFKRRGLEIARQREAGLDALETQGRQGDVAALVQAYLAPQIALRRSGPHGLAFVRLQSRLHNEPETLAFRLRREVYDESSKRYIQALERALPGVEPADIAWRMMFLIGTYLYMLAGVDRLDDLSDGRYRVDDMDELVARLTGFLVGGLAAPSTAETPGARRVSRAPGRGGRP
jgi:AcrR family transcriptional regulator